MNYLPGKKSRGAGELLSRREREGGEKKTAVYQTLF